jgi:hypothetical protein
MSYCILIKTCRIVPIRLCHPGACCACVDEQSCFPKCPVCKPSTSVGPSCRGFVSPPSASRGLMETDTKQDASRSRVGQRCPPPNRIPGTEDRRCSIRLQCERKSRDMTTRGRTLCVDALLWSARSDQCLRLSSSSRRDGWTLWSIQMRGDHRRRPRA